MSVKTDLPRRYSKYITMYDYRITWRPWLSSELITYKFAIAIMYRSNECKWLLSKWLALVGRFSPKRPSFQLVLITKWKVWGISVDSFIFFCRSSVRLGWTFDFFISTQACALPTVNLFHIVPIVRCGVHASVTLESFICAHQQGVKVVRRTRSTVGIFQLFT